MEGILAGIGGHRRGRCLSWLDAEAVVGRSDFSSGIRTETFRQSSSIQRVRMC
jgi:hypothetical protein